MKTNLMIVVALISGLLFGRFLAAGDSVSAESDPWTDKPFSAMEFASGDDGKLSGSAVLLPISGDRLSLVVTVGLFEEIAPSYPAIKTLTKAQFVDASSTEPIVIKGNDFSLEVDPTVSWGEVGDDGQLKLSFVD